MPRKKRGRDQELGAPVARSCPDDNPRGPPCNRRDSRGCERERVAPRPRFAPPTIQFIGSTCTVTSVIRCADAAGADAVVLAGTSVDAYNPKTVRASVGSLFHLSIAVEPSAEAAVRAAEAAGLTVLAADGAGETGLYDAPLTGPTAWLFGNEAWGLPDELAVPRLPTPRPRVPPGSVGLADRYAGIYPTASPGGWRLVGRTDVSLFDPDRTPPALLTPGTRVRLVSTVDDP